MKKKMILFVLLVLLLISCSNNKEETESLIEENNTDITSHEVEEGRKELPVDLAKFHFVVDWLTDTKIVFVEKDDSHYYVKTFDITTGEIDVLHKESKIIVDVLIHPSKKTFLLHTTDNPSSATIKIISLEGVVLDEITIASSELAIEWNDLDPKLLLFTAFYQDWTYDTFLYNGTERELNLIALEDPFPKWLGEQTIVTLSLTEHQHSLDGGTLILNDYETGKEEQLEITGVVHFDTNEDSLLFVQINEEQAAYKIINQGGVVLANWEVPAISNYSEWVIPDFAWIQRATIIMPSTSEGGQLDELTEPFKLVRVDESDLHVIIKDVPPGKQLCSPDGLKCLAGYSAETLIDTTTKEVFNWLTFPE